MGAKAPALHPPPLLLLGAVVGVGVTTAVTVMVTSWEIVSSHLRAAVVLTVPTLRPVTTSESPETTAEAMSEETVPQTTSEQAQVAATTGVTVAVSPTRSVGFVTVNVQGVVPFFAM